MTYYMIVFPNNKWLGTNWESRPWATNAPWTTNVPGYAWFSYTEREAFMCLARLRKYAGKCLKAEQAVVCPVTFPAPFPSE